MVPTRRMSDAPYLTLADRAEVETRVRASRFLAVAAPAEGEDAAREVLAGEQRKHFDATHHCFAWRLHAGAWRAADAGEPAGSAGPPILAAIDGLGVQDCVVVVTRWFGGTKLGVGGLVRAYGEAAAEALRAAPLRLAVPARRMRIRYPYEHTSVVMRLLERLAASEVEHGYGTSGAEVRFTLPAADAAGLHALLGEQTSGRLHAEELGDRTIHRAP